MVETLRGNIRNTKEIMETVGKHAETLRETVGNGQETGET